MLLRKPLLKVRAVLRRISRGEVTGIKSQFLSALTNLCFHRREDWRAK